MVTDNDLAIYHRWMVAPLGYKMLATGRLYISSTMLIVKIYVLMSDNGAGGTDKLRPLFDGQYGCRL